MTSQPDWADFVSRETLFGNAIRLRNLIWTIQRYVEPNARLLEAGFGSGTTAVLLADMGYRVTAVDLNGELVRRISSKYSDWIRQGRLTIQQADILKLPFSAGDFDLAYHQGVLEHFSDEHIVQSLREQARVSRRIIFDIPNERYGSRPFGDERLLPVRHWRRLIARAGLEVTQLLGREFQSWMYALPYGLLGRQALAAWPGLLGRLGRVSIFVCQRAQPEVSGASPD